MSADFSRAPSLAGAFLGYEYQDVVAAGLLAVGLVEGLDFLATEIPRGSDTAFDDIETRQGGRTTRFQVKHSTDVDRRLRGADLGRNGTLSLTGMAAAAAEEPATAQSYRVLLTWSEPDENDLAGLLVAAPDVQPALPGWATRRYRLDAEMIWPSGAVPAAFSGLDVARADRAALVALCERVVFEFAAPAMSRDLDTPGPSERWLISYLANNVGLGRFPNPMSPEVAADRLVRLATTARPRTAAVDLARVRQRLELRTTFGRLEQLTPVEPAYEVRRRRQVARILRLARTSPITLLTAGPGAGKTWAIEEIIRLSRRADAVARLPPAVRGRAARDAAQAQRQRAARPLARDREVHPLRAVRHRHGRHAHGPVARRVRADAASHAPVLERCRSARMIARVDGRPIDELDRRRLRRCDPMLGQPLVIDPMPGTTCARAGGIDLPGARRLRAGSPPSFAAKAKPLLPLRAWRLPALVILDADFLARDALVDLDALPGPRIATIIATFDRPREDVGLLGPEPLAADRGGVLLRLGRASLGTGAG